MRERGRGDRQGRQIRRQNDRDKQTDKQVRQIWETDKQR